MAAKENKQAQELVKYFITQYMSKSSKAPIINRFAAKWAFLEIMEDLEYEGTKELIDYYFSHKKTGHGYNDFIYNYEKLLEERRALEEDKERKQRLMKETELRAKEWREQRTKTNQRTSQE